MILACGVGFGMYVNDFYHARESSIEALESDEAVTVIQLADGSYVFAPENADRQQASL